MREGSTMSAIEAKAIHSLAQHAEHLADEWAAYAQAIDTLRARHNAQAMKAIASLLEQADQGEAEALGIVRAGLADVDLDAIANEPPPEKPPAPPINHGMLSSLIEHTLAKASKGREQ
jgi:hypothetical protein